MAVLWYAGALRQFYLGWERFQKNRAKLRGIALMQSV
jgi:hypothetical protein